jgi:DNA primase
MAGRVVIPTRNETGELVAYAGRALDAEVDPRYKFPRDFHKSSVLFNLNALTGAQGVSWEKRVVVVVEGFFDCMKMWQAGFPSVALMGSGLSPWQTSLLSKHFTGAVLMFDGDDAGKGVYKAVLVRPGAADVGQGHHAAGGGSTDQLSEEEIQRRPGG